MKKLVCLLTLFFVFNVYSQYGRRDSNRIGISGGLTHMSLFSKQFNVTPELGWVGGFSMRGNYYNDWQMIFGMNFTQSKFSLENLANDKVTYTLSGVQIYLTGSYMIVENHLTFEIGPVLQVNGKLAIDDSNLENTLLKDSPLLTAKEFNDITKINGNVYAGITFGVTNFRVNINYQYGLNNILNNLNNKEDLKFKNGESFKGNLGMLTGMLTIYL